MRNVLLYIALVGVPLLLLIAVLQVGRGLVAPRSIGGSWEVTSPLDGPIAACVNPTGSASPELRVSQSGLWVVVSVGAGAGPTIAAELAGQDLVGRGAVRAGAGCPGGTVELVAALDGDADRLTGTLALRDCDTCAPSPFAAVRRPEAR